MQPPISVSIGDGRNTSFWFDTWHPCILWVLLKFPESLLKCLGLSLKSKVVEFIKDEERSWPRGRRHTTVVQEFQRATPNLLLQQLHREDHVRWNAFISGEFSVRSAMRKLYHAEETVAWYKLVWWKGYVPKYAFVLWLVL